MSPRAKRKAAERRENGQAEPHRGRKRRPHSLQNRQNRQTGGRNAGGTKHGPGLAEARAPRCGWWGAPCCRWACSRAFRPPPRRTHGRRRAGGRTCAGTGARLEPMPEPEPEPEPAPTEGLRHRGT